MKKKVLLFDGMNSCNILIDFESNQIFNTNNLKLFDIKRVDNNVVYLDIFQGLDNLVLAFDDKFAFLSKIDSPYLAYHQPISIWKMPLCKALFFEIAKNACTSVLTNIYLSNWIEEGSPKPSSEVSIWKVLFWNNHYYRNKMLLTKQDYALMRDEYADYTKFLVYDDPIKRFLRMANNKYIIHHEIASSIRPPYDTNISDFIDKLLLVIQLNCLNSFAWDQHIAPISLIANKYFDDITDFVYLQDLDEFFLKRFNFSIPKLNVMPNEKKVITMEKLSSAQIDKIKAIYKNDYMIPEKYKDKFFCP